MGMNPEIKAQWVVALRSGEYEQGRARLATVYQGGSVEYCCLGVLCDLAVKAGLPVEVKDFDLNSEPGQYRIYDGQRSYLPASVANWAGLSYGADSKAGDEYLGERNDRGVSFAEIAGVIEQYL